LDRWTLDDGKDSCLEASVSNWHSMLRKIPQEYRSQAGNLKIVYEWTEITQE